MGSLFSALVAVIIGTAFSVLTFVIVLVLIHDDND